MKAVAKYPGSKWSLAGWNRYETASYSQTCSRKREIIWTNYEPPGMQLSFRL